MSHKHKHKIGRFSMTQWLNDSLASILLIAVGNDDDTAVQNSVKDLTARLATDEGNAAASNAEFQTAITALVKQLSAATPPVGPVPAITGLSLANGSVNGGESVAITGTGFSGATSVHFGSVAATSFNVVSDTSVTAVSPAQNAGMVDVTVTTAGGISPVVQTDKYVLA